MPAWRLGRHATRTLFVRLPRRDWARITQGEKREVRLDGSGIPRISLIQAPTPVVAYSPPTGLGGRDFRFELMACEEAWREPLGAISPESLEREGFASLAEFRRYWKDRHQNGRFNPLTTITVLRLRPWEGEADEEFFGRLLLERLYLDVVRDGPGHG